MVAFRKLFPVLAIGAFLLGTATTASAQATGGNPLVCNTNAGVPPVVRAEGYTELVGDIVMVCTGGNPAQAFDGQLSAVLEHEHHQPLAGDGFSEALADDRRAGRGASGTRLLRLADVASNSAPGRSPDATGSPRQLYRQRYCSAVTQSGTYRHIPQGTYTRVRGNRLLPRHAERCRVGRYSDRSSGHEQHSHVPHHEHSRQCCRCSWRPTSLVPTQIFAFLSISASQSLALNNPQQAVAFVLPGLQFDVRTCNGGSRLAPRTSSQCTSEPGGSKICSTTRTASGPFGAQLGFRFREGFQTAFKTVGSQYGPA